MMQEIAALPAPDAELSQRALTWLELTQALAQVQDHPRLPFEVADDYLRGLGLWMLQLAWCHLRAHVPACPPQQQPRWHSAERALQRWVLPEWQMRVAIVRQALQAVTTSEVT